MALLPRNCSLTYWYKIMMLLLRRLTQSTVVYYVSMATHRKARTPAFEALQNSSNDVSGAQSIPAGSVVSVGALQHKALIYRRRSSVSQVATILKKYRVGLLHILHRPYQSDP